ncbi:MAG: CvpA family protein [Bacteroidota bacterium]|nr:CvpA family protein [Bacteroidota bacterium]MDP4235390.1 CvpA family protein [Bacteroidota bacterium]
MIIDIIIILFLCLAAFRGWRKGAVRIIGSFLILIASIVLATIFGTQFGRALGVGPTLLHPVIGFFILFVILLIIGSFLKRLLTPKGGLFSGANKIVGLILNTVIAVLVLGLIFGFLRIFQIPSVKVANGSVAYPIVLRSSAIMVSQLKPLASQLSGDIYEDIAPEKIQKTQ